MTRFHSARYLDRFTCVQERCPDTCCTGLRVSLSEPEYHRLAKTFAQNPALTKASRGKPLLVLADPDSPQATGGYGFLAHADGDCALLEEGRCNLHRHAGETYLSDVCSLYPRTLMDTGTEFRAAGTLACPEIARLVLTDERSLDPVVLDEGRLPRQVIHRKAEPSAHPWHARFDDVEAALRDRLDDDRFPLMTRLFILQAFANVAGVGLKPDGNAYGGVALDVAIDTFQDADHLATLAEELENFPHNGAYAMLVARNIFLARLLRSEHPRYREVVHRSFCTRVPTSTEIENFMIGGDDFLESPEELWSRFFETRQRAGRHEALLDRMAVQYCRHYLQSEWYTKTPSLPHYVARLFYRLLMVRTLFFLDPHLSDIVDDADEDALASHFVACTQLVAKELVHVPAFGTLFDAFMVEQGLTAPHRAPHLLV